MDEATYERFMAKVEVLPNGCWYFHGKKGEGGYSYFWFEGKSRLAHRFIFEQMIGPIPAGQQVEHRCHTDDPDCPADKTCKHRACVNFLEGHLEVLTAHQNVMRSRGLAAYNAVKTHCGNGHELTARNTYLYPSGERGCRTCRVHWDRDFKRKRNPTAVRMADRTHCPRGHRYDEANTRVTAEGKRVCITCRREWDKQYRRQMSAESDMAPGAVLSAASLSRKQCKRGHEWRPETTKFTGKRRVCLVCLGS